VLSRSDRPGVHQLRGLDFDRWKTAAVLRAACLLASMSVLVSCSSDDGARTDATEQARPRVWV
jgi:hypothetical protein